MTSPRTWRAAFRVREYVGDSLPLLCTLLGVLLGFGSARLDDAVTVPVGLQYTPATATTVLSTIVGAMVGLLGLVVTIGILVVQQATTALSPRFMRLWYRQRLQKVVLGTFAATFAFANLRRVADDAVPDIGVTLAGLLCASSLVLLVYLDHFVQNLRPVAVAARVAAAGQRALTEVARVPGLLLGADATWPAGYPTLRVHAAATGAIQAVHARGLLAVAHRHGCTVVVLHGVGSVVPAGAPLIEVYGSAAPRAADLERSVSSGPWSRTRRSRCAFWSTSRSGRCRPP